jgi:tetratricopeptide (TPR) repeat protein
VSDAPTASLEAERARPQFARYRACEFQGRGGMGEVWLCRDEVIGREVGLKRVIRDDPLARERFVAEAQITGQLEHPGIVPVHDLGLDEEGKPFYVMKFVRGQTLKCVIDDAHAGGRVPTPVERLRLLEIFVDLARAVAYAHSRGVIHRDLKPDNVMIGPYGETVVLDWGLAKLKSGNDLTPAPAVMSPRLTGRSSETQDGGIFGSPLYMSPEMAQGLTAKVDERTDIYLLGATLYEILTGRPPRAGKSRDEILEIARTATPVAPRRLARGVPRALEAICLKALSFRRERRYTTALELAADVQAFVAGEAVSALREGVLRRAWRWSKRHRRGLARVAAVLVVSAAIAAGSIARREAETLRAREHARVAIADFFARAEEAQFYAANTDALGERAPYFDRRRGLDAIAAATATATMWGEGLAGFPLADDRPRLGSTLYDLYLLHARLTLRADATAADLDAAATSLDRAAALRPGGTRGLLRLRAELANRRTIAEAAPERTPSGVPGAEPTAEDLFLDAEAVRTAPDPDPADGQAAAVDADTASARSSRLHKAVGLYEAALRLRPDHFWSRYQLGRCQLALGRAASAADIFSGCVALRQDSPWPHSALGLALALLGRHDEAEATLTQTVQRHPGFAPARLNRGVARLLAGRTAPAADDFDHILDDPKVDLPEAAYYRGQLDLAAGHWRAALDCFARVTTRRPDLAVVRLLAARAHFMGMDDAAGLAEVDRALKAPTPALRGAALRRIAAQMPTPAGQTHVATLALVELKAATTPNAPAGVFQDLGAALEIVGPPGPAIDAYTLGIGRAPERADLYVSRAWARVSAGQIREALADFDRAARLRPDYAEALAGRGFCSARLGDAGAADRDAAASLAVGADDYLVLHNVACLCAQLSTANTSRQREDEDRALALLTRAVRLWRAGGAGPDEIRLITNEPALTPSIKARAELAGLLRRRD